MELPPRKLEISFGRFEERILTEEEGSKYSGATTNWSISMRGLSEKSLVFLCFPWVIERALFGVQCEMHPIPIVISFIELQSFNRG